MTSRFTHLAFALALPLSYACSKSTESSDPGEGMGGQGTTDDCSSDLDCRDGVFCNGDEVCDPLSPAADAIGCRTGVPPCPQGMCNEGRLECESTCADDDGDGHRSAFCGGDDCDDNNSDRYPGNPERCDDVDQDCDPSTVGNRDRDGDGSIDEACCNGELCGLDCDDEVANKSRLAPEVCDGIDNDCNGEIDDGVILATYVDADFDGFGDSDAEPVFLCQVPFGSVTRAGDCDDDNSSINPSLPDVCDGINTDCDEDVDEGADALCAAVDASALCVREGEETASCRALVCRPGHFDCDGNAANGCEANLCDDVATCGGCGRTCGAATCEDGYCPNSGAIPPPDQQAGVVVDGETGSPIDDAQVQVVGVCSNDASWTSGADGSYDLSATSIPAVKGEKAGYLPTLVSLQADIPLFSEEDIASYAADLGLLPNLTRYGVVIVDMDAGMDLDLLVSSPHQAPGALSGVVDPATQRVVIFDVAPGTTTIEFKHPEHNCTYSCDGPTSTTVYMEAATVVYLKLENCGVGCVG